MNDVPGARQSRDPGRPAGRLRFSPSPPRRRGLHIVRDDFFLRIKSHLSLIPSLLLSKAKPHGRSMPRRQLRLSAVPGFAFVLTAAEIASRTAYRSRRLFQDQAALGTLLKRKASTARITAHSSIDQ